jgi:4'-phosphopantetheinyl transferase
MPAMAIAEVTPALANRISTKGTIEVHSLCLLSCKGETERLAGYLCASERERAARFHFPADYDRYVAARAALRLQLGAFLDCDPKSLVFQYTSHGKPFVENCGIDFNLSHSGDWVLFAFSRSAEIGVDIEHIRLLSDMRDVAQHNFSAAEFTRWEATPEGDRTDAFYRCWTRKESFIKAIGEGLSCPLDSFEVAFGLDQPARLTSVDGDAALAAQWWMADLPGFAGYAAAVTARHTNFANISLVVREIAGAELSE